MASTRHRFGAYSLDSAQRSLQRDGQPLALNARYFDALLLLLREQGRLVSKQQFFDEVWAGTVVSDAALTQCIKEIRRALGDDAAAPQYVRTVAGHGYSFIAPVSVEADDGLAGAARSVARPEPGVALPPWLQDAAAASAGGAAAGVLGGLLYGSALAFAPQAQGLGTVSVLLVLLVLCAVIGMAGAAGVGLGLVAGRELGRRPAWMLAGAALGGFLVGGFTKLIGSDTFVLLVGHAPAGTTGGLEGAALGLALAAGLQLGGGIETPRRRRAVLCAALCTGLAGALLSLAGGSLMAGSLARVADTFEGSRIDLSGLSRWFGEAQFGPMTQALLAGLEGGLFGACVVAALLLSRARRA